MLERQSRHAQYRASERRLRGRNSRKRSRLFLDFVSGNLHVGDRFSEHSVTKQRCQDLLNSLRKNRSRTNRGT